MDTNIWSAIISGTLAIIAAIIPFIFRRNETKQKRKIDTLKKCKKYYLRVIKRISIIYFIVMFLFCSFFTYKIYKNASSILSYELENFNSSSDGTVMERNNASNKSTLRLLRNQYVNCRINISTNQFYEIIVRYANDDYGQGDSVVIKVDNIVVASFKSIDTKPDRTSNPGIGWNYYTETEPIKVGFLERGKRQLNFMIIKDDGEGIELDNFVLKPSCY